MAKAYHIPACIRCHSKKIRCDTDHPRCRQCARADTRCEFRVSTSSQNTMLFPRGRISAIESKLHDVEVEYALSKLDKKETALVTPSNGPERATLKQSTVKQLMKTYFSHCQFPYLILLEDEFSKKVEDVYAEYGDIFANPDEIPDKIFFMASLVMAISLLSLACRAPKAKSLAEVTFRRGIGRLNRILSGEKNAEVLQCVLLLLLYSIRHCTSLVHPWYVFGIAQQLYHETRLYDGASSQNRIGLCLTFWSMDFGLSKAPFRVKDWVEEVSPKSLQEQQTIHFIQLQRLQDLVTTRLHPLNDQGQDEDRHGFIVAMFSRLEDWKIRAQQLATADIHTTNLWELWYSGTALRLLRPQLLQKPAASDSLQRCYSFSTEVIDISFAQLFIRRHVPVTYSWKDTCDIILASVIFLYIISTSKDTSEDDASHLSRQYAKLTAILKTGLQNWEKAARAQQLLLSLAKHTMDNIHAGRVDGLPEGEEQQRLSKRPKITPDTNERSNLSCSEDEDAIDLPVPRAKVRRVLAHHDSVSEAHENGTNDDLQESFFNHEFVGQHRVRIMSTILGIHPPQTEGEYLWDEMNGYRSFVEFVDALHCAQVP